MKKRADNPADVLSWAVIRNDVAVVEEVLDENRTLRKLLQT